MRPATLMVLGLAALALVDGRTSQAGTSRLKVYLADEDARAVSVVDATRRERMAVAR